MNTHSTTPAFQEEISVAAYSLIQRIEAAALKMIGTLSIWAQRIRERRQLANIDRRILADIGLSQADLLREMEKPFWRA